MGSSTVRYSLVKTSIRRSPLARVDFKIKIKQIDHTIAHFDQWNQSHYIEVFYGTGIEIWADYGQLLRPVFFYVFMGKKKELKTL